MVSDGYNFFFKCAIVVQMYKIGTGDVNNLTRWTGVLRMIMRFKIEKVLSALKRCGYFAGQKHKLKVQKLIRLY